MFNVVSYLCLKMWDKIITNYWFFSTLFPVFHSIFNVIFILNKQLRLQYNSIRLPSCWHSYAWLVHWLCDSNGSWKTIWNYSTSQSNNHRKQWILRDEYAPMQILKTRTWEKLIALKLSFQTDVPFLNHSRVANTFQKVRVWTYNIPKFSLQTKFSFIKNLTNIFDLVIA